MADHNRRFPVAPREAEDAHRPVLRTGCWAEGEAAVPVEDEKGVRSRVDAAKAEQAARPDWKPAPDHPWRRAFKPAAAERTAA